MSNRQDHVLAGGEAAQFRADLPRGCGVWREHQVQIAVSEIPAECGVVTKVTSTPLSAWAGSTWCAVVSQQPRMFARRFEAYRGGHVNVIELTSDDGLTDRSAFVARSASYPESVTTYVADLETWQSRWGLIAALRRVMPVILDRCSVADFRALTGVRTLPPLIDNPERYGWILHPDGGVGRADLPPQ